MSRNPELEASQIAEQVLSLIHGHAHDNEVRSLQRQILDEGLEPADAIVRTLLSKSGIDLQVRRALSNHLHLIHNARLLAIRQFLPAAETILDLGGINAPLYHMGYAHSFKKLYMIDLPVEDRHEMYSEITVDDASALGEVSVLFADMTKLDPFENESVDLVWSGQSIEHVPFESAKNMIKEAFRVLRPGGCFALDTPNGAITSIHAQTSGLEVVHPEHFIEYTVDQMTEMLSAEGFDIESSFGTSHMPVTFRNRVFNYTDFVLGSQIHPNPEECYSQFHICRKPK